MSTATLRRTAKLSPPRKTAMPYVMVFLDYIAPETTILPCTANKDMDVHGENGAVVHLKAGEAFHLVRSKSIANGWYIVRNLEGYKRCSCPATKPCEHEKDVAARREARQGIAIEITGKRAEIVTPAPRSKPCSVTIEARMEAAPLNGNRGFSILKV